MDAPRRKQSARLAQAQDRRAGGNPPDGAARRQGCAYAPASPGARRGLRVLLIEDNEDHILLARRALEQRWHVVTSARTAAQAMGALSQGDYDAVALDYQLPDADGLELLDRIVQRAGSLPVVMVTASGSERVAVAALKHGARDYVVKATGYERELARALELAWEQARAEAAEAALRADLERRASTDYLTGLLNRGEMERRLEEEIGRALRYGRSLSFALVDIDGFKAINDACGHMAGDNVLRQFAQGLREAIRASDRAARWGGDEFAVLMPETDLAGAQSFADRLRRLVMEAGRAACDCDLPALTVSAGVVSMQGGRPDLGSLLRWADRALYAAKAKGRGQAEFVAADQEAAMNLGYGAESPRAEPDGTLPENLRRPG